MSSVLVVEEEISLVHGGIMAMSKVEIYKNGLALLFGKIRKECVSKFGRNYCPEIHMDLRS